MKQGASSRRVNEQARQVIAEIVMFEISDPRLELVTITDCEVSFDRSVCNVYYTASPEDYDDVAAAFKAAASRIRTLMGKKLTWRVAPELRFFLDKSVDQAERIARALQFERARTEHLNKGEGGEAERAEDADVSDQDASEQDVEETEQE